MLTSQEPRTADPRQREAFPATHWSVILKAGEESCVDGDAALEKICRNYWFPLYAYVRRQGHNAEDAQDLTQGFFAQFLRDKSFKCADPLKGRFRSFLLASMQHFLANDWHRANAIKRGGGAEIVSLDEQDAEGLYQHEPVTEVSPERLYERRWALTILENALQKLRQEYCGDGKENLFTLLKQFLSEHSVDGAYKVVAAQSGMSVEAVAVAVCRLRRKYRTAVRAEVTDTVTSAAEVDDEMRNLFAALA